MRKENNTIKMRQESNTIKMRKESNTIKMRQDSNTIKMRQDNNCQGWNVTWTLKFVDFLILSYRYTILNLKLKSIKEF